MKAVAIMTPVPKNLANLNGVSEAGASKEGMTHSYAHRGKRREPRRKTGRNVPKRDVALSISSTRLVVLRCRGALTRMMKMEPIRRPVRDWSLEAAQGSSAASSDMALVVGGCWVVGVVVWVAKEKSREALI